MIGFVNLEVYISVFNITEENKKFELYTDKFYELGFTELKNDLEDIFNIGEITPEHLQHEKIGPLIIKAFRELRLEKSNTDGFTFLNGLRQIPI